MAFSGMIPVEALVNLNHTEQQLHLDPDYFPEVYTIDPAYLCTVNIAYSWVTPTGGTGAIVSQHVDHPAFASLRNRLESRGLILTERGWLNGDVVLKPFILNNHTFQTGDKFYSGAAIRSFIENNK